METTASQLSIVYFLAREKTYKLINCLCIFSLQDQLKGHGYKAEGRELLSQFLQSCTCEMFLLLI